MTADYDHLVINHANPAEQRILPVPRRGRIVTDTYATPRVTLELDVVATAPGFVCVRQERPGQDPWNAWIPSAHATPLWVEVRARRDDVGHHRTKDRP